jgi:hypothetical protein
VAISTGVSAKARGSDDEAIDPPPGLLTSRVSPDLDFGSYPLLLSSPIIGVYALFRKGAIAH